jgi:positive regulator of sigma E activity
MEVATNYTECKGCGEQYHIVVPEKKCILFHLVSFVLVLPFTLLGALVIYIFITILPPIPIFKTIGILISLAGIMLAYILARRYFEWRFSLAQDNPYTWD